MRPGTRAGCDGEELCTSPPWGRVAPIVRGPPLGARRVAQRRRSTRRTIIASESTSETRMIRKPA